MLCLIVKFFFRIQAENVPPIICINNSCNLPVESTTPQHWRLVHPSRTEYIVGLAISAEYYCTELARRELKCESEIGVGGRRDVKRMRS
jgi:hypothetical protein